MRILGIDPGTINMGYGVIETDDGMQAIDFGVLNVASQTLIEKRLCYLYDGLTEIIARSSPDEVAIEEPFLGKNARTAFVIGAAKTIAILAAARQGLPIYYYSPTQVKRQVTSYGQSDKLQVQEMVKLQLGLSSTPEPHDASDALAVAICHISCSQFDRWVTERS
jgi:crossover junction endodeoxyribonuclease RuvC